MPLSLHHRISDRLFQKIAVEPSLPVSLRNNVIIIWTRRTQWSAFVHDINHSGNPLSMGPYSDRFFPIQMRPTLISVKRSFIGGRYLPYQDRHAVTFFLFNRSDRAVPPAPEPELVSSEFRSIDHLCRRTQQCHLFQVQIAAIRNI